MDKISIIVPAYNVGPYLGRCLDSLLAQQYENIEIIVVDDGSTDDTRKVLMAYAARHLQIQAYYQENSGVTAARLLGVAKATGQWIAFVDGDDEIAPEMYQLLLTRALDSSAEISHCGHQLRFPDGRVSYVHNTGVSREQDRLTALRDLLDGGLVDASLCTKLYRRELFAGIEVFMDLQIRNNEDFLMNYYLFSQAKSAIFLDICPYYYILRPGSASYRRFRESAIFDPIFVREKILADCEPALKQDARIALLRNLLFAYAQIVMQPKKLTGDMGQQVREKLIAQKEFFPLLSSRNQILARMIVSAPWSFALAYRVFVSLFQREEQH